MRRRVAAGGRDEREVAVINPAYAVDRMDVNAAKKVEAVQRMPATHVPPPTKANNEPRESMLTGSVRDPNAALLVDEDDVPDLPMARDETAEPKR